MSHKVQSFGHCYLSYIYINNFSQASSIFKFIMYADDTTLFNTLTSFRDNTQDNTIESVINAELSKVVEWLNINKAKYMIFHVPSKGIHSLTLKILRFKFKFEKTYRKNI